MFTNLRGIVFLEGTTISRPLIQQGRDNLSSEDNYLEPLDNSLPPSSPIGSLSDCLGIDTEDDGGMTLCPSSPTTPHPSWIDNSNEDGEDEDIEHEGDGYDSDDGNLPERLTTGSARLFFSPNKTVICQPSSSKY